MGKAAATKSVAVYREGQLVWFRRAVRQRHTARRSCGGARRNPIEGKFSSVEVQSRQFINLFCFSFLLGECLRAGGVAFYYSVAARRYVEVDSSNAGTMTTSEEEDRMIRECIRLSVVVVMPTVEGGVGK